MAFEPRETEDGELRLESQDSGGATSGLDRTSVAQAEEVVGRGASTTIETRARRIPILRSLTALHHRDYQLFWTGQIVSLVGTWMQTVAQSWLVLELSGSPLTLGVVSALQFLPILAFSMLGGVVADRLPKRNVLLATQSSAMVLAFVLGGLTETGLVRVEHVMALALLLGIVNAVDMPTRQSFVVELVGRQDLRNAIALNSAAFNSARLVGPAVAGLAIGWIGVAGCFFANGLSFIAVIIGLTAVRAGRRPIARLGEATSVRQDIGEGLTYVAKTPVVRLVVLLVAVVGTFGMNMNVLVPVLARDVLQVGAAGYGVLTSAMGIGSLLAALTLATLSQAPRRALVLGAAAALGLLQVVLAGIHSYPLAILVLAGMGFSMIFFTTLSNTALQTSVPDSLRGRVMSVYTMVFAGSTPFGSLFAGGIAQSWGVALSFLVGGLISAAAAAAGVPLSRNLGRAGGEGRSERRDGKTGDRDDGRAT